MNAISLYEVPYENRDLVQIRAYAWISPGLSSFSIWYPPPLFQKRLDRSHDHVVSWCTVGFMCNIKGCEVCHQILSALECPLWFCRSCRHVKSDPRVVRHHLNRLLDAGKVKIKPLGGVKYYKLP
jgi:hypothetical protein